MRRGVIACAVVLLGAWVAGPTASGKSAQVDPAAISAVQPTVEIDAVVTDASGRALTGLARSNFEVLEGGRPLPIGSVSFSDGDRSVRRVAVYLDEYHVTAGPALSVLRERLRRFIDEDLDADDMVAFVRPLDLLPEIRFTRERGPMSAALDAFMPRKADFEPRDAAERLLIASSPERVEAARAQVTISALTALAARLGALGAGRKALIVVSEGFVRSSPLRGDEGLPSVETLVRVANRAGVSIYPVDPRALTGSPDPGDADRARLTLRRLAGDTAGLAYLTPEEARRGFGGIAADAARYYSVTFEPPSGAAGRHLHEIAVRVDRPGAVVRARSSYWTAPLPSVSSSRSTRTVPALTAQPSPLVHAWFGMTRRGPDAVRVQFIWEPATPAPGSASGEAALISLRVLEPDGAAVLQTDVLPVREAPVGSTGSRRANFDLPPGRFRVQMEIRDAEMRVVDRDVRDIVVRPSRASVEIGAPLVFRTQSAREYREVESDPEALPNAVREFKRTDRLLFRVPIYSNDAAAPVFHAYLGSAGRSVMREVPVDVGPSGTGQVDLPLDALQPGDYSLEVTVATREGRDSTAVMFRVIP